VVAHSVLVQSPTAPLVGGALASHAVHTMSAHSRSKQESEQSTVPCTVTATMYSSDNNQQGHQSRMASGKMVEGEAVRSGGELRWQGMETNRHPNAKHGTTKLMVE
jgi:hypothetical protein